MSQITEVAPGIQDRGGVLVASPTIHSVPSKRKTTKWQGVPMMIDHSFNDAVRDSVEAINATPLITHNVCGTPGSGKSTLIESLCCQIHRLALKHHNITFQVHHWGESELKDVEGALSNITMNSIISFDDISYAHRDLTQDELTHLLKTVTKIRHRKGMSENNKTIMIYAVHYTKAIPTYFRQSEFFWVHSASSSGERKNLRDVFEGHAGTLLSFERMRLKLIKNAKRRKTVRWGPIGDTPPAGKPKEPIYEFRNPFAPVLYGGVDGLRLIAYPKRTWINPHCGICDKSEHRKEYSLQEIDDAIQPVVDSYGSGGITAIKLWLTLNGIWSYSPNVKKARVAIDKIINDGYTRDDIEKWYKNYIKSKSDKRRQSEQ